MSKWTWKDESITRWVCLCVCVCVAHLSGCPYRTHLCGPQWPGLMSAWGPGAHCGTATLLRLRVLWQAYLIENIDQMPMWKPWLFPLMLAITRVCSSVSLQLVTGVMEGLEIWECLVTYLGLYLQKILCLTLHTLCLAWLAFSAHAYMYCGDGTLIAFHLNLLQLVFVLRFSFFVHCMSK